MAKGNEGDLESQLKNLSAIERAALLAYITAPKKKAPGARMLPMVYEVPIRFKCGLCGSTTEERRMSSVNRPILLDTPSCQHCTSVLMQYDKEKLVQMLLRMANKVRDMFAADAKLFPYRAPEASRHEVEEEHDTCSTSRVQQTETLEIPPEEVTGIFEEAGLDEGELDRLVPDDEEVERVGDVERVEQAPGEE